MDPCEALQIDSKQVSAAASQHRIPAVLESPEHEELVSAPQPSTRMCDGGCEGGRLGGEGGGYRGEGHETATSPDSHALLLLQ